jgi:hypothetical protein
MTRKARYGKRRATGGKCVNSGGAMFFQTVDIIFRGEYRGNRQGAVATEIHRVLCKQFGEDSDVRQRERGAALDMAKDRPTAIGRPF